MIKLVRIECDYINRLREEDSLVQSNMIEENKETKPFLGVLFELDNNIEYFVPLSSPKSKHLDMANSSDFHKVVSKKGKLRAVLNFNNMIPVVEQLYTMIDLNKDKDRFVLMDEYIYCRDNEDLLKKKAQTYYSRYLKGKLRKSEIERTCDFKKLEILLQDYIKETNIYNIQNLEDKEILSREEQIEKIKKTCSNKIETLIKDENVNVEEEKASQPQNNKISSLFH